eukprot:2910557-Pyramimonas_sp.AAC.1
MCIDVGKTAYASLLLRPLRGGACPSGGLAISGAAASLSKELARLKLLRPGRTAKVARVTSRA